MKSSMFRMFCRFLIASLLFMSFASARAAMIGADQATLAGQADRAAVVSLLDRADVANGLKAYGVDPQAAKLRVAAMTDREVSTLRGNLDALPAGGTSWGWWAVGVIAVAVIIWYLWGR